MKQACLIVGDSNVGKTTFLKRHKTGEFTVNHIPTSGCTLYKLYDNIVIDTSGPDDIDTANSLFDIKGVIIMFDVTNRKSFKNVFKWLKIVREKIPNIDNNIVVCGNKVERQNRKVSPNTISYDLLGTHNVRYYDVSAKANYNYEKPFLWFGFNLSNEPMVPPECTELE